MDGFHGEDEAPESSRCLLLQHLVSWVFVSLGFAALLSDGMVSDGFEGAAGVPTFHFPLAGRPTPPHTKATGSKLQFVALLAERLLAVIPDSGSVLGDGLSPSFYRLA